MTKESNSMITTDFTPHSPQTGYTATIEITGTKEELSVLYDLLQQAEPSDDRERRIKDDVLKELRNAHAWLTDMESVRHSNPKTLSSSSSTWSFSSSFR
jgi:hypothetical protein